MTSKMVRRKSEILYEEIRYLPTYLVNDKPPNDDGICTLFVRRYKVLRLPSGRYRTDAKTDVMEFPDSAKMLRWIELVQAKELPQEADGDPRYIPDELRGAPSILQLLEWGAKRARA